MDETKAGTPKHQKGSRIGVLLILAVIALLLAVFLVLRPRGASSSPSNSPALSGHQ